MERSPWTRALVILAVLAVGFYVGGQILEVASHFADIIILFFLAWLVAFMLLPVVHRAERILHIGRGAATAMVYLILLWLFAMVVVLIVPIFVDQLGQLIAVLTTLAGDLPTYIADLQTELTRRHVQVDLNSIAATQNLSAEFAQFGARVVANSLTLASGVASGVFAFTVISILSFYLVLDGEAFLERALGSVSDRYEADARLFVNSISRTFGGFLRGTAIQMVILGTGTGVIMILGGLPYVVLASIVAGLVMVVPFIGPLLALMLPAVITLVSGFSATRAILILSSLVLLQIVVMNIVAPKVMASSVGLHPLIVFLALFVGAKQAGVTGAIFGVPFAAIIYATVLIVLRRWQVISEPVIVEDYPLSPIEKRRPRRPNFDALVRHLGPAIGRIFHLS